VSAPADRGFLGLAIVIWLSLARIVYVALRLVLGKPLVRRRRGPGDGRGRWRLLMVPPLSDADAHADPGKGVDSRG